MRADANGLPDPATMEAFAQAADFPVDLEFGPNGELFYPDIVSDSVRRISFTDNPGNNPPTAVAAATPQSGSVPLDVNFNGSESSDPDPGDMLSYAWDLDDDGELDDSTSESPSFTYTNPGVVHRHAAGDRHERRVRRGHRDDRRRQRRPPTPTIDTPAAGTTWGVDESIDFTGSAIDAEDGTAARLGPRLAADRASLHLSRELPPAHASRTYENTAGGTFVAPDHEYPSHLELKLTATDSHNNTATVSRRARPADGQHHRRERPTGNDGVARPGERRRAGQRDVHRGVHQHAQRRRRRRSPTTRPTTSRPGPTASPRRTTSRRRRARPTRQVRSAHAGHLDAHLQPRRGRVRRGGEPRHQLRQRHHAAHRRRRRPGRRELRPVPGRRAHRAVCRAPS